MIAILLPVLGRAQQIQQVLDSIAEATVNAYTPILICSPEDDALETALASEAETIVAHWQPGHADYAKKLALGYRHTEEPWIFQGATDLRFYARWDEWALKMGKRYRRGVVGTNDLGNPLVKRGLHSTHSLISRDYLERFGGTCDGSGVIFSEAYDHQWTDNEFIETAKKRRQFVFCKQSMVEHLHPHWGKSDLDSTYEKALKETDRDRRTFITRREKLKAFSRQSR